MTKLSWSGLLLMAGGLALVIFAPQTRSCWTDHDLTVCAVTGSAAVNALGHALIGVGVGLAFFGLERRTS